MVGVFVFGALLAQQRQIAPPPVALIFGGGREQPIMRAKMLETLQKAKPSLGWQKAEDDIYFYVSPKHITYAFLPSLREIYMYKALQFFRPKIEKGGLKARVTFGELPEFMQNQLRGSFANLDFKPQSTFNIGVDSVANISALGRKVGLHQPMLPKPETGRQPDIAMSDLTLIEDKQGTPGEPPARPVSPELQIWTSGLTFDANKPELINDALTEFHKEMDRLTRIETDALMTVLKDEEPYKSLKNIVGQGVNLSAKREDDPFGYLFAMRFKSLQRTLGLTESKDWDEYRQQAKIDSLSLGFNLQFAQMINGQRTLSSVNYSP